MEKIKPKKERKFLKAMGDVALTLVRELLLNVGKKIINKLGNKRQGLSLASIIIASTFTIAQYPTTGNKQRLGFQTSGDGLVFRGRASDTTALKPSTINNAYHLFDTLNNVLFSFIKTKGGWKFNNSDTVIIQGVTMPFDSITFNTTKDGTVGVGEVEYNDSQGSLIQGLKGSNVINVIGQQLHQRVNNRTGATLNKGDVVYLSGSQGNRITVAKAIATNDPTSANTFGIVAESIADNQSGYIITEGLITGLNTSTLTQDSAVYLSGTTAGALTSTKPQAPIHGVYIGVCVKTNAGSGEVFVKIRNGQELDELHDVQISSPVNNASLYFKSNEGLWRDTTPTLLVSDTASMLTNYLRTGVAASTYLPLTGGTLSGSSSNNNYTDTLLNVDYQFTGLPNNQSVTGIRSNVNTNGVNSFGIISDASTIYNTAIGVRGKATHLDVGGTGSAYGIVGEIAASGSGSLGTTYAGYFNNTSTVGGNHYGLFVNTASGGDYGIYQTGSGTNYFGSNTSIGGTLGVSSNITANSFIKSGGTSSQFLKADGTVDGTSYLPLTGGTLTGTINRQEGSHDGSASTFYYNILNYFAKRDNNKSGQTAQITFTDRPGTSTFPNNVRTSDIYLMTAKNFSGGQLGQYLDTTLSVVANQDGGRIGISKLNPAYKLDVNGTLGVTGATTLSAPLTVNSSAVFNEGSTDSDFRVESDGNANMVFVDASTDRVGIGTNAPTRTLEVNGTVNATGDITENGLNVLTSADTVSLSNRINLKFNSSGGTISGFTNINATLNVVNDGAVGGTFQVGGITQLSNLAGTGTRMVVANSTGILSTQSVTERFYFDLGIVAGAADNSASTYDFSYGNNIFIVPTSLNGYCIDTVYIRAIGCSTCPPVAGDKDYYVGVYKANVGSRVVTSGASLQGSQITMNEYDLNEVNTNYTLSTGEAWWVYLNGTYTSDMAYVTAGFIVKKTCN